ncbi:MAG: hypothetical protein VXY33_10330 [Verrucomicrobiota bacterium]|nr:hypothetical protein [Verrucomicrobiota bacterium]
MQGRYYTEKLTDLELVVLDGNEISKKSKIFHPYHFGGKQISP